MSLKEKNACLGPVSSFLSFNKSLSSWVSNKLMVQAKLFLEFLLPPRFCFQISRLYTQDHWHTWGEHWNSMSIQLSWKRSRDLEFCSTCGRVGQSWHGPPKSTPGKATIPSTIYFARHPKSPLYTWSHLTFANKPRVLKNSAFSDKKTKLLMTFCLTLSTCWF